ncbi:MULTISPECIES: asparagine synthase (glutamine-hydrolyzing) [Agathobacter]|uniref:asparagine synthase (glutamine-hydrolyzing) n=1 Tax=Agathobacter ruminis TaxID=1712665 RepID=A0A2G3E5B9_9FIRM|nr:MULTISPECIES: asparagine synthase (glutamine-hydrolyzing) [Agathobacter]MBQ1681440.1 asparagine synthase (glutamine-hydrolyzing) [Agathobacter sp.]MDC7301058.1 asparagine synthase (glutamine-hydrolyzing) [Agathobacter ruminis]PHU38478.1 asparagine synthetase B [Agathobacter ruminis]
MCGICGIYNLHGVKPIEEKILDKMLEKIKHRGPDGKNMLINDRVGLGFVRLSFIDLSGGMQPIENEDRRIAMTCNGEIFNYQELREDLIKKGHTFRTKTDVEVILHLYEEYGLDFPKHLNGQFAIALYDGNKDQLVLVRDQIGICPLFYTVADDRVIYGSEIKGIVEYPGIERKLNMKAVDQLMNYPGVVSPNTFFKNIYSLRAGHMLVIRPDEEIKDIEYWDLQYSPDEEDKGEEYYVENLRELLKKAISRRLIADVPIGFYISGGLDSSVVACYIGKFLLNSYYSFSAEIGEGDLDESEYQKIVKDCVKSEHYSTKVAEEEIWNNIGNVIYHAESAVKESYDVAAYMLSGLVQSSPAKAVLTGQGSDEFFYGYVGYMVDLFRNMQKGKMTPEELEVNERLWGDPYFRFERNHPEIRKIHMNLYSKDVRANIDEFSAFATSPIDVSKVKGLSSQKRRSYIDYKLRLSDHLLGEHGDRMFFSHSVEGRHPFLDAELLDFVTKIPDKYKLKGVNEKYILKRAGEGIVPDPILKRKKFPFQAPGMSAMIKKPSTMDFLSDELIKKYGVFDVNYINELKKIYQQDDFKLMGAYEIDYLLIAMTVTMLCEQYQLSL